MRRIVWGMAMAALLGGAAKAQDDRSIPSGNPLGALPIAGAAGSSSDDDPAEAWLRAQRLAVARARAAAQRRADARPQAFALARPAAIQDPDPVRTPVPDTGSSDEVRRPAGPLPTPFATGLRPPWSSGISTPWSR